MRPSLAIGLALVPLFLACGGGAPDVANPSTFNDSGVSFQYPANWTLNHASDVVDGIGMLEVEIDGGSSVVFNIYVYDEQMDLTADFFADQMLVEIEKSMREMIGDTMVFTADSTPKSQSVNLFGAQQPSSRRTFNAQMFGVDVPHTLDVWSLMQGDKQVLIYRQVADEDSAAAEPGFKLIFDTLKVQ